VRRRRFGCEAFEQGIHLPDAGLPGLLEMMKHAGSAHNRFVLAQTLFWDNFHKNWQPGIQQINDCLKDLAGKVNASRDADH